MVPKALKEQRLPEVPAAKSIDNVVDVTGVKQVQVPQAPPHADMPVVTQAQVPQALQVDGAAAVGARRCGREEA